MSASIVPPHDKFRRRSAIIPPAATVDDFERVPRAIGALVAFRRSTEHLTGASSGADRKAALTPLQTDKAYRAFRRRLGDDGNGFDRPQLLGLDAETVKAGAHGVVREEAIQSLDHLFDAAAGRVHATEAVVSLRGPLSEPRVTEAAYRVEALTFVPVGRPGQQKAGAVTHADDGIAGQAELARDLRCGQLVSDELGDICYTFGRPLGRRVSGAGHVR